MLVKFKRDCFLDNTLYRTSDLGVQVPDEFKDRLPRDAEIMKAPKVEPKRHETLRDFDEVRAADEAFEKRAKGK